MDSDHGARHHRRPHLGAHPVAAQGKAARAYTRVRTGRVFFIGLAVFCGAWMLWNHFAPPGWRFDEPGFPILTLLLSIEASLAASAIIVAGEQHALERKEAEAAAEANRQEQDRYLLGIAKAILTLVEEQHERELHGAGISVEPRPE